MKYEELVKALRERALRENEWYEHGGDIIEDAAAAIEGLVESVHIRDKHLDELNHYIWKLEAEVKRFAGAKMEVQE